MHDLIVKDGDLVLGTHGRNIWILDEPDPIRTWSSAVAAKAVHLVPPREAIAWRLRAGDDIEPTAPNPPSGVAITYRVGAAIAGPLTMEVLDASGQVVRTMSSVAKPKIGASEYEDDPKPELATGPGFHRVAWDLRYDGARMIPGGMLDSGDPSIGPEALPGRYSIRLSAAEGSDSAAVSVLPDPRVDLSRAAREAQLAFGLELRDAISRLSDAVVRVRDAREQLRARNQLLESNPVAKDLVSRSGALASRLDSLEAKLHNPTAEVLYDILAMRGGAKLYSRLAPLYNWAIEGDGAPTQGMREVYADQRRELDGYLSELRALLEGDLAAINALASELGVGHVVLPERTAVP
ncbi:MAG: hypothetical protein R2909_21425 [Gemmatimonadales bacterium]